MSESSESHPLGRIDLVERAEVPALSRDVALDIPTVQAAWPEFENSFDSLNGRKMMGLIHSRDAVYRLASVRIDRDVDNPRGLAETVVPGGHYLRLRLRGEAGAVYGQIAAAFDVLFQRADHDPDRPHIEYYRREGQVDCLVPVRRPDDVRLVFPATP